MISLQNNPIEIESDENIFLVKETTAGYLIYEAMFEIICFHKNTYILDMRALPCALRQLERVSFAYSQTYCELPPNLRTRESRMKQREINLRFLSKLVQKHFSGYESYQFS